MQNIVLITRENSEKTTHASVFLCNRYDEASLFSGFMNHLSLAGGEKLYARRILMGQEYTLEKRKQTAFEGIVNFDDRTIQKMMREVDACVLAKALNDSSEAVRDKIFRNMSRRAAAMLKEDMEYMGPVDKTDTDNARRVIMDAYDTIMAMGSDEKIEKVFAECSGKNTKKEGETDENSGNDFWADYDREKTYIVLVMRGVQDIAERVSVMLFDTEESANNCCELVNKLKTANGFFVYARRAEQMVEYETEKPLLVRFDRIFDYKDEILGKALAKVGYSTIIKAIKGLDARSREKILLTVPEWMEEKVLSELERMKEVSKEFKCSISGMTGTKLAQQSIVDAMIAIDRKIKKDRHSGSGFGEVVKD
jgi:hypothetical protein